MAIDELRQSQMMNHLLDALDKGEVFENIQEYQEKRQAADA
jgi:hypothetical protein